MFVTIWKIPKILTTKNNKKGLQNEEVFLMDTISIFPKLKDTEDCDESNYMYFEIQIPWCIESHSWKSSL